MVDKKLKKYTRRLGLSDFDRLNQGDPSIGDYTIDSHGDVVRKPAKTAEELDYIDLEEDQEPDKND